MTYVPTLSYRRGPLAGLPLKIKRFDYDTDVTRINRKSLRY